MCARTEKTLFWPPAISCSSSSLTLLHLQGAGLHGLFAFFSALSFTRVPASGRGLAEPLPVMLELEKRGRIGAELPGPVILYALQHRIFALSAFAPR